MGRMDGKDKLAKLISATSDSEWRKFLSNRDQTWAFLKDYFPVIEHVNKKGPSCPHWNKVANICIKAVFNEIAWREKQAQEDSAQ